jgi:hypothetical protein
MRLYEGIYSKSDIRIPLDKCLVLYNHYIRVFSEWVSSTIPKNLYFYLINLIFLRKLPF